MAENQSSTQLSSPAIPLTKLPRRSRGGRGYQVKGLLHAKRFTMELRNCDVCGKALPTPRPNPKRTCDECLSDPVRLESMRKEDNKRERDRAAAKRAATAPQPAVIRDCQHRQEKDGPICGAKFEAKPRIDKNGVNRGVHAEQIYCAKHQEPKAVARRKWLNHNVENYRRLQRDYRHRNLPKVRKYQREAAKAMRGHAATGRLLEKLRGKRVPATWKRIMTHLVLDPSLDKRNAQLLAGTSLTPRTMTRIGAQLHEWFPSWVGFGGKEPTARKLRN